MRTASDSAGPLTSSFRDPSGHVFVRDGRLLRQVNRSYALQYERLLSSGLYDALAAAGLLIPHRELPPSLQQMSTGCSSLSAFRSSRTPSSGPLAQLKAAALTTLHVQKRAVDHGMVLKDASAYNIQFRGATPVLIDTLSFDIWEEGTPWGAYRQFCQHFLGPLALMSRTDVRLGALSRVFIDGLPLDLVADLLPFSSRLAPSLLVHVHLHARAQRRHGSGSLDRNARRGFTRTAMLGLVEHLEVGCPGADLWRAWHDLGRVLRPDQLLRRRRWPRSDRLVEAFVERLRPATVWDLGANTGMFSRIASAAGAYTVACDGDPAAVERHYLDCRTRHEPRVLPLVIDLANPSGPMGWNHEERQSLLDRGPADLVMALGLDTPPVAHEPGAVRHGGGVLPPRRPRAGRRVRAEDRLAGRGDAVSNAGARAALYTGGVRAGIRHPVRHHRHPTDRRL